MTLRQALEVQLAGADQKRLAAQVDQLITAYRQSDRAPTLTLREREVVEAYAAYRMPATHAAVTEVLHRATERMTIAPQSLLDLGGGTGAAAWAVAETFPGLRTVRVIDQSAATLALGREIAARSDHRALAGATWSVGALLDNELPTADLATISYLLGELAEADRAVLFERVSQVVRTIVIVEPGTRPGTARILEARDALLQRGWSLVAPCPHASGCPMAASGDWCHFSVRLARSSLHRRVKRAELAHEDEKFAYLVATRDPLEGGPDARIVRHPQTRKGMVTLRLCTPSGELREQTISRRHGDLLRWARDSSWGGSWEDPPLQREQDES